MRKIIFAVLFILLSAFAVITASEIKKDKKNAPALQTIENASLTIAAPPLERRENLEEKTKESLKEKIKTVYYYSSSYKKAEYLVCYCEYKNEARLRTVLERLAEKLKENGFAYESKEDKTQDSQTIYINGTFYKDGAEFAIKMRLEKKLKKHFWQILAVYPHTGKNNKAAEEFMDSVSFGGFAKSSL